MEPATTTLIVLKELAGNPPPQLNMIQSFLAPHTKLLAEIWLSLWIMTAIVLIVKYWHEYKERKTGQNQ